VDNIKIYLREVDCKSVNRIEVAQGRIQQKDCVITLMTLMFYNRKFLEPFTAL
jgi:hypothetical protein